MTKIHAKSLKEAKENLKIAEDYYSRNMVFPNYQALQQAKKELKYWEEVDQELKKAKEIVNELSN